MAYSSIPPQPYHLPGYGGHCPEYKYRIADTFGSLTHKVFLDPCVFRSEKLVISDRIDDEYQIKRPLPDDITLVNNRPRVDYSIYHHPMTPGYQGFVPRISGQHGQRFTVSVTEAMSQHERLAIQQRRARKQITADRVTDLKSFDDKEMLPKSKYRMPLFRVRPECAGILRNLPIDEPNETPAKHSTQPYFQTKHAENVDNNDVFKLLPNGYLQNQKIFDHQKKEEYFDTFHDKPEHVISTQKAPADVIRNLHDALSGHTSSSVAEAVKYSEKSKVKCIGITIETRPDYCLKRHLSDMLLYGCTRLEIGVQSVYEDIARDTNRGHTVRAVCESFQMAKDAGFKVVAHMMPDLPNVDFERDVEQFMEFFENPAFRADGLKIYPTLVIRGTGLYELWKTGRYKSYPPSTLVDLIARVLALVPPWTRVYRVQRDIPMPLVSSGVEHGNLRELALARMKDLGTDCRDVRTREVGIQEIHNKVRPYEVELIRRDYVANGGWETFLAYEDPQQDILVGLLRLRKCSDQTFRPELRPCKEFSQCSIVRELHVYGRAVPVNARDPTKFQHQGFGLLLMEEAERIAQEEHGSEKIVVISGVGTRNYYTKMGYYLEGPYMVKMLNT